jgi:segregation and condensation protein B
MTNPEEQPVKEEIETKPEDQEDLPIREEDLLKEDEIRETIQKRIKQFRRKGGKRSEAYNPDEVRKSIEALLFASGRPIKIQELAMLIRLKSEEAIRQQLIMLQKDYDSRDSPISVAEDNNGWKLTVRERHLPLIARINPNTELSKTLMETLAVVAWKQPILQSEIIRIRTNKAYEHLSQLEEMGFLTKEKHGRTQLVKLSQKFFEYFDLQGRKDLQQLFAEIQEGERQSTLEPDRKEEPVRQEEQPAEAGQLEDKKESEEGEQPVGQAEHPVEPLEQEEQAAEDTEESPETAEPKQVEQP